MRRLCESINAWHAFLSGIVLLIKCEPLRELLLNFSPKRNVNYFNTTTCEELAGVDRRGRNRTGGPGDAKERQHVGKDQRLNVKKSSRREGRGLSHATKNPLGGCLRFFDMPERCGHPTACLTVTSPAPPIPPPLHPLSSPCCPAPAVGEPRSSPTRFSQFSSGGGGMKAPSCFCEFFFFFAVASKRVLNHRWLCVEQWSQMGGRRMWRDGGFGGGRGIPDSLVKTSRPRFCVVFFFLFLPIAASC